VCFVLINLVIGLAILGVVLWLINTYLPMDGRIKQLLNIVAIVGAVLWVMQAFGVFAMGGPLMSLVIVLAVLGVLLFVINNYMPMDEKIKKIVNVVVLLIAVLAVLQAIGVVPQMRSAQTAPTLRIETATR
jgi:hypothetical protein